MASGSPIGGLISGRTSKPALSRRQFRRASGEGARRSLLAGSGLGFAFITVSNALSNRSHASGSSSNSSGLLVGFSVFMGAMVVTAGRPVTATPPLRYPSWCQPTLGSDTMPVPGLPARQIWDNLPDHQKISLLYEAIDQIWGSLVLTGQQLTGRVDFLERRIPGDLDRTRRRIKALEDRPSFLVGGLYTHQIRLSQRDNCRWSSSKFLCRWRPLPPRSTNLPKRNQFFE